MFRKSYCESMSLMMVALFQIKCYWQQLSLAKTVDLTDKKVRDILNTLLSLYLWKVSFTDSSINVRLLSQSFIDSDATDEHKHLRWLGSKHKKRVVMGYRGLNIQCKTYIICECNQSFELFFKIIIITRKSSPEKK